jgi:hypothetical protein
MFLLGFTTIHAKLNTIKLYSKGSLGTIAN